MGEWRKSARCDSSACVEARYDPDKRVVYVRDSKERGPYRQVLHFDMAEWAEFTAAAKRGEYDFEVSKDGVPSGLVAPAPTGPMLILSTEVEPTEKEMEEVRAKFREAMGGVMRVMFAAGVTSAVFVPSVPETRAQCALCRQPAGDDCAHFTARLA